MTTPVDHISHLHTASGTHWTNRWTSKILIINNQRNFKLLAFCLRFWPPFTKSARRTHLSTRNFKQMSPRIWAVNCVALTTDRMRSRSFFPMKTITTFMGICAPREERERWKDQSERCFREKRASERERESEKGRKRERERESTLIRRQASHALQQNSRMESGSEPVACFTVSKARERPRKPQPLAVYLVPTSD